MLEQGWRRESTIDVINLALGIGLMSTPWIFGFTGVEMASRNAWIAGAIVGVAAIAALVAFAAWEEWVNVALGLWIAISPWALSVHLAIGDTALRVQVAIGLVIAVLAAVELWIAHRAPPHIAA
ncbi:MAG: SPW repeat protein [Proteobacteria bacterium]|nr:SPW repeat protein [Pseudomonadota bacterium]